MHGRVFSLMQVSNSCVLPLGMMLFGPLADIVKIETRVHFLFISASAIPIHSNMAKRAAFTAAHKLSSSSRQLLLLLACNWLCMTLRTASQSIQLT